MGVDMIKLDETHRVQVNRNSSKGNQLKWKKGDTWYKADFLGYEALAEFVISLLLEKTNVHDYVQYQIKNMEYAGHTYIGCCSKDFLQRDEVLITLPRLFNLYLGEDVYMECERLDRTEADCIKYVVDNVIRITGIEDFGEQLTLMLELDAFFLNEDRHFHNMAVIYNEQTKTFRSCPIFDNGGALFSDMSISYSGEKSMDECRNIIKAKPFSPSFADQVEAAQSLYGGQFQYWFTEEDIHAAMEKAQTANLYSSDIIERVENILIEQMLSH